MTHPDLQEEIGRLEAQLEAHPGSLLFARLADLVRKDGDHGRALEILERGLEDHPEYLSAHIVRARALEDLGRETEAEEAYRRVLELDDQNLVALAALARAAEARGDREDAVSWYERLLAVDPRNEEAEAKLQELRESAAEKPLDGASLEREVSDEEPTAPAEPAGGEPVAEEEPAAADEAFDGAGFDDEGFDVEPFGEEPSAGTGETEPHDAFGVEPGEEIRAARWPWDEESGSETAEEPPSDEIVAFSRDGSGVESEEELRPGSEEDAEDPFSGWENVDIDDEGSPDTEDLGTTAEEEARWEPAEEELTEEEPTAEDEPHATEEDELPAEWEEAEPGREEAEPASGAKESESTADREEPEPEPAPEWEELEARGEDLVAEWEEAEPEDLETEIDELSDGWDEPEGEEAEGELDDDSDLPTETLASLYASQGLYREAVTIYEELVRRRPHDEALFERLRAAREELDEPVGELAHELAEDAEEPAGETGEDVREPADELGGTDDAAGPPEEAGEEPVPAGEADGTDAPEPTMREHLLALLRGEAVPDGPAGDRGA
ncbi:MAG TPA: tetratricopeptide repeat protein [Gemmatimonadota bacterium]|nr:tetratricopeptide repeat protein [Gemmatimonadota bacterium]